MVLLPIGVIPVLAFVAAGADPTLLWDNGLSGTRNAHAISPPIFPKVRQADDFVIEDEAWLVTDVVFQIIEDTGWKRGATLETFFYDDGGGDTPGPLARLFTGDYVAEFTGQELFDRDEYHYWVHDLSLALDAGTHWLGPRNPEGGGVGTNYWVECHLDTGDCGPDATGSFPNASSLDEGETWQTHGTDYNFQYALYGYRALDATPFTFEVTRGMRVAGGLLALAEDDGVPMEIAARRPTEVSQPSVEVVIEGLSPVDFKEATAIGFTLDAHASAAAIERIDLYNWVEGRYVRLHETLASIGTDRTTDVVVRENVSEFITPASTRMRARISYYDPGIPVAGWFGRIDQAIWRVGRPTP